MLSSKPWDFFMNSARAAHCAALYLLQADEDLGVVLELAQADELLRLLEEVRADELSHQGVELRDLPGRASAGGLCRSSHR